MCPLQVALGGAATLIAAAGECHGDLAHVNYTIRFADPLITPGEKQTVEVWWEFVGEFEVGIGPEQWFGFSGPSHASELLGKYHSVGGMWFSLLNINNAQTGTYTGQQFHANLGGAPGVLTPEGHIIDVIAVGGLPPSPFVITQNPTFVWLVDWTPTSFEPRFVVLDLSPEYDSLATISFEVSPGHFGQTTRFFPSIGESASFKVVPAPATLLPAAIAFAALRRRHR